MRLLNLWKRTHVSVLGFSPWESHTQRVAISPAHRWALGTLWRSFSGSTVSIWL